MGKKRKVEVEVDYEDDDEEEGDDDDAKYFDGLGLTELLQYLGEYGNKHGWGKVAFMGRALLDVVPGLEKLIEEEYVQPDEDDEDYDGDDEDDDEDEDESEDIDIEETLDEMDKDDLVDVANQLGLGSKQKLRKFKKPKLVKIVSEEDEESLVEALAPYAAGGDGDEDEDDDEDDDEWDD